MVPLKIPSDREEGSIRLDEGSPPASNGAARQWQASLAAGEMAAIWGRLYRIVARHPLVRSGSTAYLAHAGWAQAGWALAGGLASSGVSLQDLTQDLYLQLFQKGRFDHYRRAGLSDGEIEREVSQIELTNLLLGKLRRERPEHYRLARRVGVVLAQDPRFQRVVPSTTARVEGRYRQLANGLFGLRVWGGQKEIRNSSGFAQRTCEIPVRGRDRRRTGCTGESQVIISSGELADLLEEILRAIDSPASLRVLRRLALDKLSLYDPVQLPLDEPGSREDRDSGTRHPGHRDLATVEATPESALWHREGRHGASELAAEFLTRLSRLVRGHPLRTERLWRVVWHVYFDPRQPSQIEIARLIGLSDSSVSDYRRRLLGELKRLALVPDQVPFFTQALEERLLSVLNSSRPSSEAEPPVDRVQRLTEAAGSSPSNDRQGRTGDRPGAIGSQEEDHFGDLLWGDPALTIGLRHRLPVGGRVDDAW